MKTLSELVEDFARNVTGQKEALRRDDVRAGNRCADKYMRAWRSLRERGDEGREALASLLNCESADVRGMAAACLLRYRTDEAQRVLKEVAEEKGLAAFGASQALERWAELEDKDRWGLDPVS